MISVLLMESTLLFQNLLVVVNYKHTYYMNAYKQISDRSSNGEAWSNSNLKKKKTGRR